MCGGGQIGGGGGGGGGVWGGGVGGGGGGGGWLGGGGGGGEGEGEGCASVWVVLAPEAAVVEFDDGAADGQAHAQAVALGGEEGAEDFFDGVGGQAGAAVADRRADLA